MQEIIRVVYCLLLQNRPLKTTNKENYIKTKVVKKKSLLY